MSPGILASIVATFGLVIVLYWFATDGATSPAEWRERNPGRLRFLRYLLGVIVVLAIADLFDTHEAQQPLPIHPSPRFDPHVAYKFLAGVYGFSICYEGRPYTFIAEGISQMEFADTKAHEAVHRQQYARFESCEAFEAWYAKPSGKLLAETEAAHAGWCTQLAMGADTVSSRRLYVQRIAAYIGATRGAVDSVLAGYGNC